MKIAIIGAGNMGGAIARGLAYSNVDIKIAVADLAQDKLDELMDNTVMPMLSRGLFTNFDDKS